MNQEILDRIDALAIKLGTTAEYLWPKLVGHAQVSALTGISLVVLLMIAGTFAFRKAYHKANEYQKEGVLAFGSILFASLLVGSVITLGICVPTYFYPEAEALRSILR